MKFDYCIVDEASQLMLPTCLGPLRFAETFILVGDHYQLPPLVKQDNTDDGLSVSLFKRLSEAHPNAIVNLEYQYRMNSDIMMLSNEFVYSGRLKCGNDAVSNARLYIPNFKAGIDSIHQQKFCAGRCDERNCWIAHSLYRLNVSQPTAYAIALIVSVATARIIISFSA